MTVLQCLAVISFAVTVYLLSLCLEARKKRKEPEWEKAVLLPGYYIGFGIFLELLSILPACFPLLLGEEMDYRFLPAQLFGWMLQFGYLQSWVLFDGNEIRYGNIYGKKKTISCEEITRIQRTSDDNRGRGYTVVIISGKRHCYVSPEQKNYRDFLTRLSQRVDQSKWIRVDRSRWDPYNHNRPLGWIYFILTVGVPAAALIYFFIQLRIGSAEYRASNLKKFLVFLFAVLIYTIAQMVVYRHPERYRLSVRRLFAKNGKMKMPPDPFTDALFPEEEQEEK